MNKNPQTTTENNLKRKNPQPPKCCFLNLVFITYTNPCHWGVSRFLFFSFQLKAFAFAAAAAVLVRGPQ